MHSSARTASAGGSCPSFRYLRMLLYDAVSTSIENVDSGLSSGSRNLLSENSA